MWSQLLYMQVNQIELHFKMYSYKNIYTQSLNHKTNYISNQHYLKENFT